MLTREEVLDLIETPKISEIGSELIFQQNIVENIYQLKSENDESIKFKVDLTQHKQIALKLSCHHRNSSNIGLIRVDYNGPRHNNPKVITTNVPKVLHPYASYEIAPRESHIHLYVEDEGLNWAMPLKDFSKLTEEERDGILVPQINIENQNDKISIVKSFVKMINFKGSISTHGGLIFN